jgi:Neprosin
VQRYGDTKPHLFVYWTPDTYQTGSFNLDGGFFVPEPNASYLLGISLNFSQTAGSQAEYRMGFFLTGGAWWFYFNGQWVVGYYPLSLFHSGPLSSHADTIELGGETNTDFGFGLLWVPARSPRPASARPRISVPFSSPQSVKQPGQPT